MPSFEHEALVQLFRNRPALAAKLWALASGEPVPDFDEADVSDASLGELVPTERRADLVVMLRRKGGEPVLGIVVEVQLDGDPDKQYVWPLYAAALAARMHCTVALLVICRDGTVAAWAQRVMEEQRTRPAALEIGPGKIPRLGELPDACLPALHSPLRQSASLLSLGCPDSPSGLSQGDRKKSQPSRVQHHWGAPASCRP